MRPPSAVMTSSSAARVGFMPRESRTRLESGKSSAAQRKNAADEMSPGTVASMAWRFLTAGDETALAGAAGAGAGERCAEGLQSVLGVVAGADGFGEAGDAFRLQAGEEDGSLDLG
jgi:hypothetical protein